MNENGLCTSTWGSPGWFFLHCVAAGYPVDPDAHDEARGYARGHTRRAYTTFFKTTGTVLPCRFCRDSYASFITETPIEDYIHTRKKLFEWLFIIHNKVNAKLGDKQEPDLASVVDKYERFRASCNLDKSEESKGCTEPAEKKVKLKCRLIIEPIRTRTRWVGWGARSIVAVIISVLL
ncbi:unnamed protein product, partial [Pylaiella littoralis]